MNEPNKKGRSATANPPPKAWQIALAGAVLLVLVGVGAWMIYSTSHQFIASPATPGSIDEKFAPSGIPSPNPALPVSPVHPSPALPARVSPIPTSPPAPPTILRDRHHPLTVKMRPAALPWQRLAGATNTQRIASAAIPWHGVKPAALLPAYATVPWKRLDTRPQFMQLAAVPWQRFAGDGIAKQPIASAGIPWHGVRPVASLPPYATVPWKRLNPSPQSAQLATLPWQRSDSGRAEGRMPLSAAAVPWRPAPTAVAASAIQPAAIPWQRMAGNEKKQAIALAGVPWQRSSSGQAGSPVSSAKVPWRPAGSSSVAGPPLVSASLPWRQNSAQISPVRMSYAAIPSPHDSSHPQPVNIAYAALTPYLPPMHAYAPPHAKVWDAEPATLDDLAPRHPGTLLAQADPKLAEWLRRWMSQPTTDKQSQETKAMLASTPSDALTVYRVGRVIQWCDGNSAAAPFFAKGVTLAAQEFQHDSNPALKNSLLHALGMMSRPLWDTYQWAPSAELHGLLVKYASDAETIRRAQFMQAESLYTMGRGPDKKYNDQAAEILASMLRADDVIRWSALDRSQLHFLRANALYQSERFAESIPDFREAIVHEKDLQTPWLQSFLIRALAHTGKVAEAKREYQAWIDTYSPTQAERRTVLSVIERAESALSENTSVR